MVIVAIIKHDKYNSEIFLVIVFTFQILYLCSFRFCFYLFLSDGDFNIFQIKMLIQRDNTWSSTAINGSFP